MDDEKTLRTKLETALTAMRNAEENLAEVFNIRLSSMTLEYNKGWVRSVSALEKDAFRAAIEELWRQGISQKVEEIWRVRVASHREKVQDLMKQLAEVSK